MYLISRGEVEVMDDAGNVVATLGEGNFFGEISLLTVGASKRHRSRQIVLRLFHARKVRLHARAAGPSAVPEVDHGNRAGARTTFRRRRCCRRRLVLIQCRPGPPRQDGPVVLCANTWASAVTGLVPYISSTAARSRSAHAPSLRDTTARFVAILSDFRDVAESSSGQMRLESLQPRPGLLMIPALGRRPVCRR